LAVPPKFNEYRAENDAVMVADIGFKKQLRALDPELDVIWDWGASKWEIWRFPGQKELKKKVDQKAHHVLTIQTQGKKFRELGADILLKLQAGDTQKYTLRQLTAYFDQLDRNIIREKERKLFNNISALNRDLLDAGVYKRSVPKEYLFESSNSTRVRRAITGGL